VPPVGGGEEVDVGGVVVVVELVGGVDVVPEPEPSETVIEEDPLLW